MDLFLINGQDGISLPEMIDWDIKLSNPEISEEVGVNSLLGLGYELPSLDIEDEPSTLWAQSYSANSNSSFELDFLGEGGSALMVNPSSIMPFVSTQKGVFTESKELEDDHVLEKKCDVSKYLIAPEHGKIDCADLKSIEEVKAKEEHETPCYKPVSNTDVKVKTVEDLSDESFESTEEIKTKPLDFAFVSVPSSNTVFEVTPSKKTAPQKRQVVAVFDENCTRVYPKPAYSYSCLIAMALKNSQKGSLPVSEIYSFMCHHFPYFKTAPSGWKNSVRHNLSLNKCFEKIEKPPGTGANGSQRKGCLWAMNPAKISKMDEEVAKWSRKDPSAIKKAMVCPDNLDLLERGELKDDDAFIAGDAEEDADEAKEEETEDELGVDADDERISPIDDDSEDEMSIVPPSLLPFEPKFHNSSLTKSLQLTERVKEPITTKMGFLNREQVFRTVDDSDTRTLLGLDDSTPIYAVDPTNENFLIELPIVKRPRVQSNYFHQPMLNMKRHNISGFRSVKIESP